MLKFSASVIGLIVAFGLVGNAVAADSAAQRALDARSASVGLGRDSVPLLARKKGAGRQVVREGLLKELRGITSPQSLVSSEEENATRTRGDSKWFLDVLEDGSAAVYWDEGAMQKARLDRRLQATKKTDARFEDVARAFVATRLRGFIATSSDDQLVPVGVRYLMQTTADRAGNQSVPEVVAARVKFGRRVGGVDVIGPGSLVIVTISNDESIVGFQYDWPSYEVLGTSQQILDIDRIKARMGTASAVAKGAKVKVERLNCGYYDSGVEGRDWTVPIQAGCMVSYLVERQANGAPGGAGIEEIVPAAEAFLDDPSWPEARRLRAFGDVSTDTALSNALAPSANNAR